MLRIHWDQTFVSVLKCVQRFGSVPCVGRSRACAASRDPIASAVVSARAARRCPSFAAASRIARASGTTRPSTRKPAPDASAPPKRIGITIVGHDRGAHRQAVEKRQQRHRPPRAWSRAARRCATPPTPNYHPSSLRGPLPPLRPASKKTLAEPMPGGYAHNKRFCRDGVQNGSSAVSPLIFGAAVWTK